ncbi:MAG: hypothetical protein V3U29_03560 [Phycisphaeraceae bacterium]
MANASTGTNSAAASGAAAGDRCVVLTGTDRPRPTLLLSGLRPRVSAVHVVADAPMALLQLARGATVLIVSEPVAHPRLAALLAAVRQYYPQVVCWQYEPLGADGRPRLSPLHEPAAESQDSSNSTPSADELPVVVGDPPPKAAPRPDRSPGQVNSPDLPSAPLITAEELQMLLGPLADEVAATEATDRHRSNQEV